jgi:hypothetical protein
VSLSDVVESLVREEAFEFDLDPEKALRLVRRLVDAGLLVEGSTPYDGVLIEQASMEPGLERSAAARKAMQNLVSRKARQV